MSQGHNSIDAGDLKAFVERIERLEGEKQAIGEDIKEIYSEAKGSGYDPKMIRRAISYRRMDRDRRQEEAEILELYLHALGDLADTPLGRSAAARDLNGRA